MKYAVENNDNTVLEMSGREKFAIIHVKCDDVKTLGIFDSIEEARSAGKGLAADCEGGIVTLISAEFDDNGNRIGNKERVYESF